MRKTTMASMIALLVLFSAGAWAQTKPQAAQTKPQAERITDGPKVHPANNTTVQIAWSTDAPGSSIVKYGASANALNETAEEPWGGTKESNGDYNHTVWIRNLKPNTTYFFIIETGQGLGTGTQAQSQPQQFHTAK